MGSNMDLVRDSVGPTKAGVGFQLGKVEDGAVVDEDVGDPACLTLLPDGPAPDPGRGPGRESIGLPRGEGGACSRRSATGGDQPGAEKRSS